MRPAPNQVVQEVVAHSIVACVGVGGRSWHSQQVLACRIGDLQIGQSGKWGVDM